MAWVSAGRRVRSSRKPGPSSPRICAQHWVESQAKLELCACRPVRADARCHVGVPESLHHRNDSPICARDRARARLLRTAPAGTAHAADLRHLLVALTGYGTPEA